MDRKILNIIMAVLMVIGLAAPVFAQGVDSLEPSTYPLGDITEFTVKVRSYQKRAQEQGGEQELIPLAGAKWELRKIGSMDATGKVTELNEEARKKAPVVKTFESSVSNDFITQTVKEAGRYELTLVTRPDGFYYGHGTKEGGAALETIKFDFPVMKNGKVAPKDEQVIEIMPKFNRVELELGLKKTDETGQPLEGATFKIFKAKEGKLLSPNQNATKALKELSIEGLEKSSNGNAIATGKSEVDGMVTFDKKIEEGYYILVEERLEKNDKVYPAQSYILEVKGTKGGKETNESDFEAKIYGYNPNAADDLTEYLGAQVFTTDLVKKTEFKNELGPRNTPGLTPDNPPKEGEFGKYVVENGKIINTTTTPKNVSAGDEVTYYITLNPNLKQPNAKVETIVDELDSNFEFISLHLANGLEKGTKDSDFILGKDGDNSKETSEYAALENNKLTVKNVKNLQDGNNNIALILTIKVKDDVTHATIVKNNLKVNSIIGDEPNEDEIPEDEQPQVKVSKAGLSIIPTDVNDSALDHSITEGEQFIITNVETKESKTVTLKADGTFEGDSPIAYGKYKIKAETAPTGYLLNQVEYEIEITDKQDSFEQRVPFAKDITEQKEFFPETGTLGKVPYMVAGGLALLAVALFFVFGKKKEEEKAM